MPLYPQRFDFMKCDNCLDEPVYRVRIEKGKGYCDKCTRPSSYSCSGLSETVVLKNSDGTEMKTTKREIEEIKRLRVLPYERPGGGWYPGRVDDRGKIQERYLK